MKKKNAVAVIELSSIHKGYEVQDKLLKFTNVEKLIARTICSGKFLILVRGEIADIESAAEYAREHGAYSLINVVVIPNVDERIFPALSGATAIDTEAVDGMLIVETFSVASVIKAADAALKESDVKLLRLHVAMAVGGKGFLVMVGNIESLKSAQEPALDEIRYDGTLAGYSLITQPHEDLIRELI